MIAELLFALVIGLLIAALFVFAFGGRGPWGGFLWFFLIVFLGAWAIGAWIPAGPVWVGVAWVPIIIAAMLLAVLLAAIPGPRPAVPADREAVETAAAVGVLFWILIIALLVAAVAAYV